MIPGPDIETANSHCFAVVRGHYENFPVASWLLPAPLRAPVAAIYAFARRADDHADEGDLDPAERLRLLDLEGRALDGDSTALPNDLVHLALADSIARFQLPVQLLHDLLTAFRMDVTKHRYADHDELLHYCRHSANPVGRLLLHLFGQATPVNLEHSDAICTALQLINLWQDLDQDIVERDRLYLPHADWTAAGITEAQLLARDDSLALQGVIANQLDRAEQSMNQGMPLGGNLPGRLGLEIRLTVEGGLAVLRACRTRENSFARPRLPRLVWPGLLWRALLPTRRWRKMA
ncbi:MAG: squalene synthase HpnC [Gammaproteobacteria bacterium]|nr:MAG: squalene synthase HpnC [Gammaproteobacteria bacterium]